jgi:hypothetical protein
MPSKAKINPEQFRNPIVHMDRDGNGYCRIWEIWEDMRAITVPTEEYESTLCDNAPPEDAEMKPGENTVKVGPWSKSEKKKLKAMVKEGLSCDEIRQRLNRTRLGVLRAASFMGIKIVEVSA